MTSTVWLGPPRCALPRNCSRSSTDWRLKRWSSCTADKWVATASNYGMISSSSSKQTVASGGCTLGGQPAERARHVRAVLSWRLPCPRPRAQW